MLLTYLMLAVALCLSAVAAFYSIIGLTAIFAGAVVPIVIMGSILEIAKLVVTVWLHEYWSQVKRTMKMYLVPAVAVLMVITSMGIFGFLSKAHLDQAVTSGDVTTKIAIYDEKIKSARDNIETNRRALKQMDDAVDQTMNRTSDEQGATKAANLRRSQQGERTRLQNEIAREQQRIQQLNEERAPIAAEVRKVEAEVGPIKYIAALIYGDNPDANLLEKAVRWVIVILVFVFDPLAVMMLLAATESFTWERKKRVPPVEEETFHGNDNDSDASVAQSLDGSDNRVVPDVQPTAEVVPIPDQQWGGQDLVQRLESQPPAPAVDNGQTVYVNMPDIIPTANAMDTEALEKEAKRQWKADNPTDTIHNQEALLDAGKISQLPWISMLQAQADGDNNYTNVDFGIKFPDNPNKGDAYIRVDYLPTKLYKWNGIKWIEVDKDITDTFAYNDNYIDHLIAKIGSGEYDPDLLNNSEREQIEQRLRNDKKFNG